jgi:hypothetical protein
MISQMVATFACGVFFGAAVYINLVEQHARLFFWHASRGDAVATQRQAGHLDAGSASLDRLTFGVHRLAI